MRLFRSRLFVLALMSSIAVAAGIAAWRLNRIGVEQVVSPVGLQVDGSSAPPHDLDRRVKPHLVGIRTCSRCHEEQAKAHATSGHSRTFIASNKSEHARALDGQTFTDPERGYTFHYKFDPETGLSVTIPEKFKRQLPLQYALGSGAHAITFLGLHTGAEHGVRRTAHPQATLAREFEHR